MKAISIRQPWAWAIIHGGKDFENRSWKAKHRGPVIIHASKRFDLEGWRWMKGNLRTLKLSAGQIPDKDAFHLGGFVGIVNLVGCVERSGSPWFFGPFGFRLEDPRQIPFTPYRGQLGFFQVPEKIINLKWKEFRCITTFLNLET